MPAAACENPSSMCLLVLLHRGRPDVPLVLAANRDEFHDRPSVPPRRWPEFPGLVAPRDLRAGGTWLGVRCSLEGEIRLVAALTNYPDRDPDPSRPSRGQVCLDALTARAAPGALDIVRGIVRATRLNNFQMFLADPREAWALRGEHGRLRVQRLDPGVHTLTNLHGLDEVTVPLPPAILDETAPPPELFRHLVALLGDHTPRPPGRHPFCKHGRERGTVSSAVIAVHQDSTGFFRFASGPPCRTPFVPVRLRATR